jgi:UDPglucose 6-dehydrogenase
MSPPRVGFVGMTHLGLVSATAVATKGFPVVCYDPDRELIVRLVHGTLPVVEPGLPELVGSNGKGQQFSADIKKIAECDVVYIAPDVPTDDTGKSDLTGIRALIDATAKALAPDAIMVILCQVPPGFTRSLKTLRPERLYYQVETLVFGRAVERAIEPERYIVGCAAPEQPLDPRFATVLGAFGCPILPMRYESAELAKISINMCLVASIAVANTLAELCENIGADWSEIAPALKLDRRIGPYSYLAPGLGIAGGNLERDLATVERLAADHKTDASIVRAWLTNSRHRRDWAAHTVRRALLSAKPNATIAVWGLAYKENTHSIKNSPSLATIGQLNGAKIRAHDPAVPQAAVAGFAIERVDDPIAAVRDSDALMILTPWPQYRQVAPETIAAAMPGRIVIDPYSVLDLAAAKRAQLVHYTLGRPVSGPHLP